MTGGSPSSFSNQWSLGTHHDVAPPPTDSLAASQVVLDSLKKRRGLETAQWLNRLNSEIALDEIKSVSASQQGLNAINPAVLTPIADVDQSPEGRKQRELVQWVDKLFDNFALYAAQFNRTAEGTDLIVNCTRPVLEVQGQPTLPGEQSIVPYEGHLVTRFWALLLRGVSGTISVYIIPAEVLLGFSLNRIDGSTYSPLLVIESEWKDDKLAWHIAETNIVIAQTCVLAKELFGDLIRVASGQMSESELFAHPLQQPCLGENLAVGYKMPSKTVEQAPAPAKEMPKTADAPPAPNKTFSLTSMSLAEQLIASMDTDTNQLFELGKSALAADNVPTFQKIKLLTEKMETLKGNIKISFSEIAAIMQSTPENK